MKAEDVLRELGKLALSDLRKLYNEEGGLLAVSDLPDDIAAAVSSVEVVTTYPNGKDAPPEYVKKYKLWDKNAALANLAKHFGLLRDLVEVSGEIRARGAIVTVAPPLSRQDAA